MIIVICTSFSSLELVSTAILLDREQAVIPVNSKIGYESTLLSRGEMRKNPSVHFGEKPPRMLERPLKN
jgi:hypothetical protein